MEKKLSILDFAINKVHEAVFLINQNGSFAFVNDESCRILGYTREELLTLGVAGVDPDFPESRWAEHWKELKEKKTMTFEGRHRKKSGEIFPVEINANFLIYENQEYNLALVREITGRKQTETELKEKKDLLIEAQHAGHIGNWWHNTVTGEIYWSDETFAIVGIEPQKVTETLVMGVLHPDDIPILVHSMEEATRGKIEHDEEFRIIRPDGTVRWIHNRWIRVNDENGNEIKRVGTHQDITEQKNLEIERQAHLNFLAGMDRINRAIQGKKNLQEMMKNVLDEVLELFQCDRAFLMFPCDPEAKFWTCPMERTRPEYPGVFALNQNMPMMPDVSAALIPLLENSGPVTFGKDAMYPLPENISHQFSIKSVMSIALYPKRGKPWQFAIQQCSNDRAWTEEENILFQEISRRISDALDSHRAYQELQRSEEKYRLIVETSNEGIWVLDKDHLTTFVNDRAADLIGYTPDELLGRPFTDFMLEEDISDHQTKMKNREKMIGEEYERRLLRKDGKILWVHASATPLFTEDGNFNGSFAMFTDITERKLTENALKRKEIHSMSLLNLSKRLEMAQTYNEVIDIAREEVQRVIGYKNLWVFVFSDDNKYMNALAASGPQAEKIISPEGAGTLKISGDRMLEEIASSKDIIVVEDARSDPRTDKKMVEVMGNRTIINIPIIFFNNHLGAVGTGTYDNEGILIPSEMEKEYLRSLASHLAPTFDRIRLMLEQKKDKEELLRSEQRLRLHAEQSPLGFLEWDENFCAVEWNAACEKIFGYTREEAIGKHAKELILPPEVHQLADGIYQDLMKQIGGTHSINQNVTKDGRKITCEWFNTTLVDRNGKAIGVASIGNDITQRQEMEKQLRSSERQLRTLLENIPDYIVRYNSSLERIYVNPAWEKGSGLSSGEVVNIPKEKIPKVPNPIVAKYIEKLKQVMDTGKMEKIEFPWENALDEKLILDYTIVPEFDENKKVVSILSVGHDISKQKEAEKVLNEYKNQLEVTVQQRTADLLLARDAAEAANKAKSVFLANMSHELRTPLNAILGFSKMMSLDSNLGNEHLENLSIINRSGEHLLKLINDILEMARIEAGKTQLDIAPFDLGKMIRDIIEMMKIRSSEKNLTLLLDQSSEFPRFIKGDEAKIRQILINLLNNAIKFTDEGGISVRLGIRENDTEHLVMEVEDSGRGIDQADLDRLFIPFEQLSTKEEAVFGTGLGLAITPVCRTDEWKNHRR